MSTDRHFVRVLSVARRWLTTRPTSWPIFWTALRAVRRAKFIVLGAGVAGYGFVASALADLPPTAEALTARALQAELKGSPSERAKALDDALAASPDYAPARWHAGFVRAGKEWQRYADVHTPGNADKLQDYAKRRDAIQDNAADHYALARWCETNELEAQAHAHLEHVLLLEPAHEAAHVALKHVQVQGQWIQPDALAVLKKQAAAIERELPHAAAKAEKAVALLTSNKPARQTMGRKILSELDTPAGIYAIESRVSTRDDALACEAIEALAAMKSVESTQSLARHALYCEWIGVGEKAAEALKARHMDEFVPALLAEVYSPIVARLDWTQRQSPIILRSNLRLAYSFVRENENTKAVLLADKNVLYGLHRAKSKQNLQPRDFGLSDEAARAIAFSEAAMVAAAVDTENLRQAGVNQRVAQILSLVAQRTFTSDAAEMWNWWHDFNAVVYGDKPVLVVTQTLNISLPRTYGSCLVEGTPVWTASGAVAIEKVKVGDMVLAQDVTTGELFYKPVIRTTVRAPSKTLDIKTSTDVIRASLGHPFWVAGSGWVLAHQLEPGMRLHSVAGGVPIEAVAEAESAETFNLIVQDANDYFVGKAKLLTHDITLRDATPSVLPGLKR